jgi:hypothetical protein
MLEILGPTTPRHCDGTSRRSFLRVGGLAAGGLSLAGLLRAEALAGRTGMGKSIIMIYLPGGPPHQDMFDLKPEAPREIRGEFRAIESNVAGIQICELLPGLARRMDKLAILRSLVGSDGDHDSYQCMTGRTQRRPPPGGWPEIGSVISALQGPRSPEIPPYISLSPKMQHRPYNYGDPGFLGPSHAPFKPGGESRSDMLLENVTLGRLGDRRQLLANLDRFRRACDSSGTVEGLDTFQRQAFGVLTSSRLAAALDLEKEDPRVRERYGFGTDQVQGDAAPRQTQQFLLARRLVEAGARVVTLSYSFWDWHGANFHYARQNFPDLDQGVSALVDDLYQRGLDKDVTVVVWGEFGRTPRINESGGRDHWPRVTCALLSGGGLRTGQAIGTTDAHAGEAKDRPISFQDVFATLYHTLGIDATQTTLADLTGRPRYLVEAAAPISELI